jgi:hypothetical protein
MPKTDSLQLPNKLLSISKEKQLKPINESVKKDRKKQPKPIHELEGRCAYFPHADYHNLKVFNDIKKTADANALLKEINDRLLHYLLIYDVIIMHSSDPLRSEIIYNILNDNSLFIENGAILFVFSKEVKGIKDISSGYKAYIQRKSDEYKKNANSQLDVESLNQEHMNDEYYRKTIELLEKVKFTLMKREKGSDVFKSLIKFDLQETEQISINEERFYKSEMKLLSLTLWQLLNLMAKGTDGYSYIFPNKIIKDFIAEWEEDTEHGLPFSRHTITSKLKEMIINQQNGIEAIQKPQQHLLNAIEIRLSSLYSKMNCMGHSILEMHPNLERNSPYSWVFLKLFLHRIVGNSVNLNKDMVIKIRKSNNWKQFIQIFALSMCDLKMALSVVHPSDHTYYTDYMPTDLLYQLVLDRLNFNENFSEIKKILLEERL